MNGDGAHNDGAQWLRAGLFIAAMLLLGGCAGHDFGFGGHDSGDDRVNIYPQNYKSEILAAMHAYSNDPTGIRDATMSTPMLKSVGNTTRYIVCLRFNGKQDNGMYAGDKLIVAEFFVGRFNDFLDTNAAREPCAGVTLMPFPELEQLKR
jgi:hypothetical protein